MLGLQVKESSAVQEPTEEPRRGSQLCRSSDSVTPYCSSYPPLLLFSNPERSKGPARAELGVVERKGVVLVEKKWKHHVIFVTVSVQPEPGPAAHGKNFNNSWKFNKYQRVGAWWAAFYGVTQSWPRLKWLSSSREWGLPWCLSGKEYICQCRRYRFDPWARKILWRRKQQPAPVFLPGRSRGQRNLVGYSPWGCKSVGHDLETKQEQQSESERFINGLRLGDQSHERNVSCPSKSRKTLETALIFI